jgi:hypothetical protein
LRHSNCFTQSESWLQALLHSAPSHANDEQALVFAGAHVPSPSQLAESPFTPALQKASAQLTALSGKLQLATTVPLHAAPHVPTPPQAARPPCDAPEAGVHCPTEPGTSQAAH